MRVSSTVEAYLTIYRRYLNFDGIAWWLIDLQTNPGIFFCNLSMCEMFGLDEAKPFHSVTETCPIAGDYNTNISMRCSETAQKILDEYQQLRSGQIPEYRNHFPYYDARSNKTHFFLSHARPLEHSASGEPTVLLGLIQKEVVAEQWYTEAKTDSLTGLFNRREFDAKLQFLMSLAVREQRYLHVLLCDIDYFKSFNDSYGHVAGDRCLQQVAIALKHACDRSTDLVFRYGGEEFAVLSYGNAEDGSALAERMCLAVSDLAISDAEDRVITISVGCDSHCPDNNTTLTSVISAADHALYQAKHAGRNRVVVNTR